jgi:hypothetical protein
MPKSPKKAAINIDSSEVLVQCVVKGMQEKKAQEIVVMDLRGVHNAFTDFFVLLYRYAKSLTYIAFDKDTLIICTNNLQVLSANSIQKIEQRHGLTYFINKNNKSLTLRTDLLKNNKLFQEYLKEWVQKNGIANKVASS